MYQTHYQTEKPNLESVLCKFERWRETKKSCREKIPDELWQSAEELIGRYTITEISKTLRLKSNDFKKHIKNKNIIKSNTDTVTKSNIPEFIELKPYTNLITNHECTIEMQDQNGSKMRINTSMLSSIDIINLTQTFWSKHK